MMMMLRKSFMMYFEEEMIKKIPMRLLMKKMLVTYFLIQGRYIKILAQQANTLG